MTTPFLKRATTILTGIGLSMLVLAPVAFVPSAHAQTLSEDELFGGTTSGDDFANSAGLGSGELTTTIASLLRVVLGFLGLVAVFIILMGGFKWMTSGGADTKVADAKKYMISGFVGLAIILAAYAIASFVIGSITGAISNAEDTSTSNSSNTSGG